VIDYKREDFTKNGQRYDLIYAVNGGRALRDYKQALTPQGICVVAGGAFGQIIRAMLLGRFLSENNGRRVAFQGIATTPQEDLQAIREMLEAGKIAPVIDKSYALSETPQAIQYMVKEHAKGKVVITVA
jgi:NADPH:quinone reductase-like Zn-dependent oxidoreductase